LGVGLTTLPCKKKIVEKPPRNSAGFCGGGQGLNWAVEPRKEEDTFRQCGEIKIFGENSNISKLRSRINEVHIK
jgi:hypothetical protein